MAKAPAKPTAPRASSAASAATSTPMSGPDGLGTEPQICSTKRTGPAARMKPEGEEEAGLGLERVLEEAEEAELLDERQRLLDQAERAKLLERREGAKLLRLREKAQLRRRGGNTKVLNVLEEVDPAGSESRRAGGVSKAPQNVVCAARGEGQEDRPRCTHGFRFATTSRTSKRPS